MGLNTLFIFMEHKVYETLGQCSAATGISVDNLSIAKNVLNAPGFIGARVHWHLLSPWLEENKDSLDQAATQDISELKRQKLIKENTLKDLEIAERRGEVLSPKEVIIFLQSLSNAQSAIFNTKEKELEAKLDKETMKLVAASFASIRTIFKSELAQWMQEQRINS